MEGQSGSRTEAPIPQASAVPFRHRPGGEVEICLITSSSGRRWGFPKGVVEPGMSAAETALEEAYEEAGLRGRLIGEPLGTYRYRKWGTSLDVVVYLMEVIHEDASWPEAQVRSRAWLPAEEAFGRLDRDELRDFLRAALDRLHCE